MIYEVPHFIIGGNPRSGTSNLYYFLTQHPNILTTVYNDKNVPIKEPHIFDFDENYENKDEMINDIFSPYYKCDNKKDYIIGEATPSYYFNYKDSVISHIKSTVPHVKLIFLFRNPIEFCISNYYHQKYMLYNSEHILEFDEYVENNKNRIVNYYKNNKMHKWHQVYFGHVFWVMDYTINIEKWLSSFDNGQIELIQSEKFFKEPQKIVKKIYKWLNVDDTYICKDIMKNVCETPYNKPVVGKETKEFLYNVYEPSITKFIKIVNDYGYEFDNWI